jgi:hypothetical protein
MIPTTPSTSLASRTVTAGYSAVEIGRAVQDCGGKREHRSHGAPPFRVVSPSGADTTQTRAKNAAAASGSSRNPAAQRQASPVGKRLAALSQAAGLTVLGSPA